MTTVKTYEDWEGWTHGPKHFRQQPTTRHTFSLQPDTHTHIHLYTYVIKTRLSLTAYDYSTLVFIFNL